MIETRAPSTMYDRRVLLYLGKYIITSAFGRQICRLYATDGAVDTNIK